MTDIVERLRDEAIEEYCYYSETMGLAADEIERLRAKLYEWIAQASTMEAERDNAKEEIERLRAELQKSEADAKIVCDSYACENQQFHDEIERLRAELDVVE